MLKAKRHHFLIFCLLFSTRIVFTEDAFNTSNCFTILVGRGASANGAVLFAHNEDDWGDQVVYIHKVPRLKHAASESYLLKNGGKLSQPAETFAYLWLEIPNANFGDAFLNEYGVMIASNACPSRRTDEDLTDGGIDYDLRRLLAERTQSARAAVKLAGMLIEQFGYNSSGRTYSIADPNEAYLLAVIQGRLWLAQRIPDDAMALIPNYYTIGAIDLADTTQFLAASNLIPFAVERGWYEPKDQRPFDFRQVYSAPGELTNIRNYARHWRGINFFAPQPYALNSPLPTYIVPKQKVRKEDLFGVLRAHYDGTQLAQTGNPHFHEVMTICSEANQYGFVAELRNWLPTAIGALLWLAPRRPCVMPFLPIYAGVTTLPTNFAPVDFATAQRSHFQPPANLYQFNSALLYWQCWQFTKQLDANWETHYSSVEKRRDQFQATLCKKQAAFEQKIVAPTTLKPEDINRLLDEFTAEIAHDFQRYLQP